MSTELLKAILDELKEIKRLLAVGGTKETVVGVVSVADDSDLDSQWGNEQIKFDPRDWLKDGGQSFKGQRMSDCPPEYLEALAKAFAWFAKKKDEAGEKDDKGRPKSFYDLKSAARARGWAKRNRARGATTAAPAKLKPVPATTFDDAEDFSRDGGDDDLPF